MDWQTVGDEHERRVTQVFSLATRSILFTSSIAPLLIVFALLDTWGPGVPSIVCVALALFSIFGLFAAFKLAGQISPTRIRAVASNRRDGVAIAYVATYIVPFLTVPADTPRKAIALGVLITLIALFYIRGELYYWNPALAVVGYRVIEIEAPSRDSVSLITRRRHVFPDAEIVAIALADNVYWEKSSV